MKFNIVKNKRTRSLFAQLNIYVAIALSAVIKACVGDKSLSSGGGVSNAPTKEQKNQNNNQVSGDKGNNGIEVNFNSKQKNIGKNINAHINGSNNTPKQQDKLAQDKIEQQNQQKIEEEENKARLKKIEEDRLEGEAAARRRSSS